MVEDPASPQTPAGDGFTHYVGEKSGGGVVFYVYKDANGEGHGLIANFSDVGTQMAWGLNGTDVANSEITWNGKKKHI